MTSIRKTQVCPWCQRNLDISAFHRGAQTCVKCRNGAAKGVIPSLKPGDPLPAIGQLRLQEEKKETSVRKAMNPNLSPEMNRQQNWCTAYYLNHRDAIPPGEYIAVIYPIEEVKRFQTYSEASLYVCDVPNETGVLVTEHPIEEVVEMAYTAVAGRFEGNPKMAYIDVKVRKRSRNPEEEKEIVIPRVLIDTGASGCFLPERLCLASGFRTLGDPNRVNATTEQYTAAQRIDIEISVQGLPYQAVSSGYILSSETKLLGMSYLGLCQQRWRGKELVELELMGDVEMKEESQMMELNAVNAHLESRSKELAEQKVQSQKWKSLYEKMKVTYERKVGHSIGAKDLEN